MTRRERHARRTTGSAARASLSWVFRADRRATTAIAAGELLTAVAALVAVLFSKVLIQHVQASSTGGAFHVLWPLFAFAAASSVSGLVAGVSTQRTRLLGEKVEQQIWRDLVACASGVELVTYESDGFISRLAQVERNAIARPLPTVRAVFTLLGSVLTSAAMAAALFTLEPILPPILLLAALPTVVLGRIASRSEFAFATRVVPEYMRRQYLRSVLTRRENAAEMRAFDAPAMLMPRARELDRSMLGSLTRQVRLRLWLSVGSSVANIAAILLGLLVIVLLVDAGALSIAEAGAAAVAARLLAGALTVAYTSWTGITEAAPHISDMVQFLDAYPPGSDAGSRMHLTGSVDVVGVSFRYPSRTADALSEVSLRIGAGEVVALVGENGSGKSTLARIVAGLYDPRSGYVQWDGKRSDKADRRHSTSLLAQDFGQYALSLADNVMVGDGRAAPDAGRAAAALRTARLDDTARSLPDGLATMLGRELDSGVDLSGGQWQRVALARALYRDTDLIVLDEPSAALDPRAESELFNDVRRVLAGRSALLISHRYASARLADRIYVLHHGRVIEQGSHTELMTLGGRYAELFELQSSAYRLGDVAVVEPS